MIQSVMPAVSGTAGGMKIRQVMGAEGEIGHVHIDAVFFADLKEVRIVMNACPLKLKSHRIRLTQLYLHSHRIFGRLSQHILLPC